MFIEHEGVKLFYEDVGQGSPALVFVHGWLMTHEVWGDQVRAFAPHTRVITPDLRGFGQSDKPPGEYTFKRFAADLHEMLNQLGVQRPILVGWSKGASIGLVYASLYPDELTGLALVGGGAKFISTGDYPYGLPAPIFDDLLQQFEADFEGSTRGFIEGMLPERPGAHPLKDDLLNLCRTAVPAVALNSLRNDAADDLRGLLPELRLPVLIACGERDTVCPVAGSVYMRDRLPDAQLQIFPGLGHAPFLTDPAAFNQHLGAFISRLRPA
jgi:pimeloyl-[acyl-carrier protein] methyl ester esterase